MADQPTTLFDHDVSVLEEIKRVDRERSQRNWNNHLPIVDVQIPNTVILSCPLVKPAMRYATLCKGCEYFHGIAQTAWSNDQHIAWPDKYAIRCGYILDRKTQQVVIE